MAKDVNKVMLTGYLGADPEMRYTPQGSGVTSFRVASGRTWKSADGTQHDDTEWFSVVAWDKLAEICNEYLTKGTRVYVEGRLQTRSWDDKESGEKRYKTEVIATDMIILSSRNDHRNGSQDEEQPESPAAQAANRRESLRAAGTNRSDEQPPRPERAAPPSGARRPQSDRPNPPTRRGPATIDNDEDIPF